MERAGSGNTGAGSAEYFHHPHIQYFATCLQNCHLDNLAMFLACMHDSFLFELNSYIRYVPNLEVYTVTKFNCFVGVGNINYNVVF